MMIPVGAKCFREAIQSCVAVYHALESMKKDKELNLEVLKSATRSAGYEPGKDIYFSANCSAMENAVWLKPERIGTISEIIDKMRSVQKEGRVVVLSQGGENDDTFLADLAVATGCNLIRLEAPGQMENVEKYNRLIKIEEELGKCARFSKFCEH